MSNLAKSSWTTLSQQPRANYLRSSLGQFNTPVWDRFPGSVLLQSRRWKNSRWRQLRGFLGRWLLRRALGRCTKAYFGELSSVLSHRDQLERHRSYLRGWLRPLQIGSGIGDRLGHGLLLEYLQTNHRRRQQLHSVVHQIRGRRVLWRRVQRGRRRVQSEIPQERRCSFRRWCATKHPHSLASRSWFSIS